jgi:CRP/FNR family transcriptional regulator, cyclic AMP receptor protein
LLPCGNHVNSPDASFAPLDSQLTRPDRPAGRRGPPSLERCINEFDADDVIFEEGSTGRELFVVIEGKVDIAKINDAGKTVIVTLGKGEFFGEMAMSKQSVRDLNKFDDA